MQAKAPQQGHNAYNNDCDQHQDGVDAPVAVPDLPFRLFFDPTADPGLGLLVFLISLGVAISAAWAVFKGANTGGLMVGAWG